MSSSNEAVRAAQEELKLAEARYAQGLGSQIELADAETAVTTASGNLITAEWQLATAWANLVARRRREFVAAGSRPRGVRGSGRPGQTRTLTTRFTSLVRGAPLL